MSRTPVTDWQQLSALYEQADTMALPDLAAWLEGLRREKHPLLPQLEQMLAARSQVRSSDFLGSLPNLIGPPEPRVVEWREGARIGPYRLARRIGTGGMAEVWLADRDDGAFQRQVAIKLLFRHAGSSDRDALAQRFSRERDILASLHHPYIAGLHDAGVTPGGQPWLALEYVEGENLHSWCDSRGLDLPARVALFRQVLAAVQHAHANLIIHRDLKPGNILVTAKGEVRLLDFGIAKLLEVEGGALADTELTRIAGRPMTPQYASPEQLRGRPLTTGSDVYSLGVVLYELLCGERPYELKVQTAAQLEQAIIERDPRPPSRRAILEAAARSRGTTGAELRRQLANDLDAIVLRALAKRPTQRYASADALGVDLDRWLAGEPVAARTPSTLYRARKFVRRHVLAVSLGTGAVLALVAITAVAVVMGLQARQDSARAVAARDFMLNIFQRANQEKSRGADITARDLLETGRKDITVRLKGQPRLQAELLRGIAKIQDDMGEYAGAEVTFGDLEPLWLELGQPRDLALTRIDRAWNSLAMNKSDQADRLLASVRSQVADHLRDPEVDAGLAQVEGLLSLAIGKAEQARTSLAAAWDRAVASLGEENNRTFFLGQALVSADRESGHIDDALTMQQRLRQVAPRIKELSAEDHAILDLTQMNLLSAAGRLAGAYDLGREVSPRCAQNLGERSQPCRYLAVGLAQSAQRLGYLPQARDALVRGKIDSADAEVPFLQIRALLLGLRLSEAGSDDDAARIAADRVKRFAEDKSMPALLRAGAKLGLAESRLRSRDWKSARAFVDEVLSSLDDRGDLPATSVTGANARLLMGISLLEEGRPVEAKRWVSSALRYFSGTLGPDHPSTQLAAVDLALVETAPGKPDEGTALVERALGVLRTAFGEQAPSTQAVARILRDLEREPVEAASRIDVSREFFVTF